jgi:uncharacterized protein (UPF0276 family)
MFVGCFDNNLDILKSQLISKNYQDFSGYNLVVEKVDEYLAELSKRMSGNDYLQLTAKEVVDILLDIRTSISRN